MWFRKSRWSSEQKKSVNSSTHFGSIMSWAQQCQQNKQRNKSTKSILNIKQHYNQNQIPKNGSKSSNNKQKNDKIPVYIRYEKQISSDDDMIIFGNTDTPTKEQQIHIIPDKDFILNHLQNTEKKLLFQLMIPYLTAEDSINLMRSCRKYGKVFRDETEQNNSLLRLWKYLYHRDFGKIKFQKKRRNKSREEQIQKHKEKLKNYKYWKEQYAIQSKKQFCIQCVNSKLAFWQTEKSCSIRDIHENDMIIINVRKCKPKDLLQVNNILSSNWFDIEDKEKELMHEMYDWRLGRGWYHKKRIQINDEYGFRNLNIDLMMDNIDISEKVIKGYVYPVRYVKLKCDLVEIMGMDGKWNDSYGREIRKCTLLESGNNDGQLIEGLIVNRIVSVNELKFKMLECVQKRCKLSVVVYGMAFGIVSESNCSSVSKYNLGCNGKYVVVDYYDE
eukprot:421478_1